MKKSNNTSDQQMTIYTNLVYYKKHSTKWKCLLHAFNT